MPNINNMGGQIDELEALRKEVEQAKHLLHRNLQVTFATVSAKEKDCDVYDIIFPGDTKIKKAVLALSKEFYITNGFPTAGDTVAVIHNNQENAHILFRRNSKEPKDKPAVAKVEYHIPSSKANC